MRPLILQQIERRGACVMAENINIFYLNIITGEKSAALIEAEAGGVRARLISAESERKCCSAANRVHRLPAGENR